MDQMHEQAQLSLQRLKSAYKAVCLQPGGAQWTRQAQGTAYRLSRGLGTVGDAVVYSALQKVQPTGFLEDWGRVAISQECCPELVTPQEAGACGRTRK